MKKGWESKALGELFDIGSSKRVLKSEWKTSGVPFYRGREITRLAVDGAVENELFISEEHFAELSKQYGVPTAGDIMITAIGTIGNTHIVRESDKFYFKDARVLWLKQNAKLCSDYVNHWFKSPIFYDQLDRGNGATVDTLTINKLRDMQIDLPHSPSSGGSLRCWTKRLPASQPPKPTPKRTSKTPVPSSKATSNPSSPNAGMGGM
jgi:type I restriction enzyme S subunit